MKQLSTTRHVVALLGGFLVSAVLQQAPTAWAVSVQPSMTVTIGGEAIAMNPIWKFDDERNTRILAGPVTATAKNGSSFTIDNVLGRPNPLLLFAASAINTTTNPLAYAFAFNTPLLPHLLGPVYSHAELGVTLTDGLNDGATVQPTIPGGKMLTSFDLYSNGTPISKNVNIGDPFSIVGGTSTTNYSADSSLVCGKACVTMSAILSFALTGQDSVGFSGKVTQSPVPVPAAALLFGSGLVGLAGLARRKMRASTKRMT